MKNKDKMVGVGIGATAVAAAAGAYLLLGKRGAKNREAIADWALQLKEDVQEKLLELKEVNQEAYNDIVDEASKRIAKTKKVSASELTRLTGELKSSWTNISKQLHAKKS